MAVVNGKKTNLLYIIFFLLGTFGSAGIALLFGGLLLVNRLSGTPENDVSLAWAALSFAFIALCGLPAVSIAVRALSQREEFIIRRPSRNAYLLLLLFPILVGLAYLAYETEVFTLFLGPIGHILAASFPIFFVALTTLRLGPPISMRRFFGHFLAGLWAIPPFLFILEILLLLPTLAVFVVITYLTEQGRTLIEQLSNPNASTLIMEAAFERLLLEPWVWIMILGFVAVLVPLTEEALKTMAIWPWLRKLSPRQAFVGGILGGAGYGMFEAFFLVQPGQEWLLAMVGRAGATIMHAFTAGISSWGIAQWTRARRPGFTFLGYACAVGFHGLWNASAIGIALASFAEQSEIPRVMGVNNSTVITSFTALLVALSSLALAGIPLLASLLRSAEGSDPLRVEIQNHTGEEQGPAPTS